MANGISGIVLKFWYTRHHNRVPKVPVNRMQCTLVFHWSFMIGRQLIIVWPEVQDPHAYVYRRVW